VTRKWSNRAEKDLIRRIARMTAWICLLLAGLFEIIWALTLKYSDGFSRLWPSLATAVAVALSFGFMAVSLKTLPFGTVYAVWGGIGAAGTMVIGMLAFGDSTDALRVASLLLILVGLVGLKLATPY
jgi:quaternary ammonium compound-resistance protein SugE